MKKTIATGLGTVILIIIAISAIYFVNKADNVMDQKNDSSVSVDKQSAKAVNNEKNSDQDKVSENIIEGPVIALNGTEIAIGNGSPQPELIGISSTTPVAKLTKDQKEVSVGLADIESGAKAKVFFNEDSSKKKIAEKIFLIQE